MCRVIPGKVSRGISGGRYLKKCEQYQMTPYKNPVNEAFWKDTKRDNRPDHRLEGPPSGKYLIYLVIVLLLLEKYL